VAKRLLWVICMLAVMTAQLYNAAFAMPMQHTTMSVQTSDTVMSHAQYDELDEMMNCCQPLANNGDSTVPNPIALARLALPLINISFPSML